MTTRTIFSSLAVLVLLSATSACDNDLETSSATSTTAAERTTTTDEISTSTTESDSTDSGSTDSGSTDSGGTDNSETDGTLPGGITIPDEITIPEDVKNEIEDVLGAAGDCANIVVDYTAMASAALAGLDNIDFEKIRSDMKAAAPSDVDDAIDTVVDGFNEMREKGIIDGTDVMSDPEFEAASDTVNEWMKNSCGG